MELFRCTCTLFLLFLARASAEGRTESDTVEYVEGLSTFTTSPSPTIATVVPTSLPKLQIQTTTLQETSFSTTESLSDDVINPPKDDKNPIDEPSDNPSDNAATNPPVSPSSNPPPVTSQNVEILTTTGLNATATQAPTEANPPEEPEDVAPSYPPGEIEPSISISIFFIFILLGVSSIVVYIMIKVKFKYLPESIAFVMIGLMIGFVYHFIIHNKMGFELKYQEKFSSQSFFLLLLPPIIFESGYSLHKGNFFQNIGSIVVFAVLGTAVSTFVVGGGLFALSKLDVIYQLNFVQSFTFGALISAVDPVATLAIFHALDVSPTLNMLVFGESVLNDAVAIVMTKTILKQATSTASPGMMLLHSLGNFLLMFCVSAIIGIVFALCSALFLKFVNLRQHYSLEFVMWFLFAFGPYFLAEGLQLSGIMAVLFCGIVMSHYTHFNLSPVTQVTVQQTMRTVSFMAETVVFLYIGMQLFTITTSFEVELIIWSLILILIGRAANIFPLSFIVNRFRPVQISSRMQFFMWFSGLRGAIAYALALNLSDEKDFGNSEVIRVLDTTTLIIVLFTIVVFGGSTLPLLKCLSKGVNGSDLTLSKTQDQGAAIPALTGEQEEESTQFTRGRHQWFLRLDYRFFKPFLIRRFTKQEVQDARTEMQRRTNEWYQGLRAVTSDEEDDLSHETVHTELSEGIRDRRSGSNSSSATGESRTSTSPVHIPV